VDVVVVVVLLLAMGVRYDRILPPHKTTEKRSNIFSGLADPYIVNGCRQN